MNTIKLILRDFLILLIFAFISSLVLVVFYFITRDNLLLTYLLVTMLVIQLTPIALLWALLHYNK